MLALGLGLVNVAAAGTVVLSNGDSLQGEVTEHPDGSVTLVHPVLGEQEFAADQVRAAIPTPPAEDAAAPAEPAPEDVATSDEPAEPAGGEAPGDEEAIEPEEPRGLVDRYVPPLRAWDGSVEFGLSGTEGNSETFDLRLGIEASRESERHRWILDAAYNRSTASGDVTDNRFTAGVLKDFLFPDSDWLAFVRGRYDLDDFEAFDHRLSGAAGLGYQILDKDDLQLSTRFGAGVTREFGSNDESIRPEANLGLNVDWQIDDRQSVGASVLVLPNLDDLGEYRVISSADWRFLISERDNLNFKLGVESEYDSLAPAGVDAHDLYYYAALLLDF